MVRQYGLLVLPGMITVLATAGAPPTRRNDD